MQFYGGKGNKGQHHWLELDNNPNCAYQAEFKKEKIIYPNMTKYLPFVYDKTGYLTNQKCFIITGSSLKYLMSVFNSKIISNWIKNNLPELQGGTRELNKVVMVNLPIPKISEKRQQQPFIRISGSNNSY